MDQVEKLHSPLHFPARPTTHALSTIDQSPTILHSPAPREKEFAPRRGNRSNPSGSESISTEYREDATLVDAAAFLSCGILRKAAILFCGLPDIMTTSAVPTTTIAELKSKVEARQTRVAVIGLGYVGLPLALLYTEQRFPVTGFDIDERKVSTLAKGGSYIYRIAVEEIQEARAKGFSATSDYARLKEMDAIIICVPTPLNEYHEPDLSYITDTAHAIAPHLRAGQLVILESTTYPGTTEEVLVPILEKENKAGLKAARSGAPTGSEFYVAFSPEREDPGNQTVARRDIPKVVGGLEPQTSELAAALYGAIFNRVVPSFFSGGRGNDQAARKHLPLREHRPGQ